MSMKTIYNKLSLWVAVTALLVALLSATGTVFAGPDAPEETTAGAPTMVNYQGKVTIAGIPFTGAGYFKFAIVNAAGTSSFWSNDGASSGGGQPTSAVPLPVSNGLFTVLLGDTTLSGMTEAITTGTFNTATRYLRVWFSTDNVTFTQLTPDQRVAAVPYALQAANADTLDGQQGSAYQMAVSGNCAIGSTIRIVNPDGTVVCQADAPLNRSLAPQDNTLSMLDSTAQVGYYSSITTGTDGLGLISYKDFTNGDLKVAHCNDQLCTAATTSIVDGNGNVGETGDYTSITIGADGLGLISYYDTANSALKVAHCSDLLCSSATVTTIDNTGDVGKYTSTAIGTDGLGLISYYDAANGNLKTAHCTNTTCSSATTYTPDSSSADVGQYTSIAIGTDGFGLISYYDYTNGNLKVAHCLNTQCSSIAVHILDVTGDVGHNTSITIGADGLGLVSYYDLTNSSLKIAHCNDKYCAAATTNTLDNSGNVGLDSSITIGADDLAMISYSDDTNGNLLIFHCSDRLCSYGTVYQLDNSASVGWFSSITIGADGLPLVSHMAFLTNDLKVAHCSNPLCIPYFRRR